MGRSLRRVLSPVVRLGARLVGRESPWDRVSIPVPAGAFGPGSERPFAQYFEGQSEVPVASIDDVVAWLQTCEYVSDVELFQKRDFWQHPTVFEQQQARRLRRLCALGMAQAARARDRRRVLRRPGDLDRPAGYRSSACLGRLSRGRRGLSLRAGRAKPFRHDSPARGCDGRVRPAFRGEPPFRNERVRGVRGRLADQREPRRSRVRRPAPPPRALTL